MLLSQALETVLTLAKTTALTNSERIAINIVSDHLQALITKAKVAAKMNIVIEKMAAEKKKELEDKILEQYNLKENV